MEKIYVQVTCCVCGKWRLGDEWVQTQLTPPEGTVLSHGYCPPCAEEAKEKWQKEKEKTDASVESQK